MDLTAAVLDTLLHGSTLTRSEATEVLGSVLRGDVDAALIASLLTLLAQRGETVEEMTGFVDAMLAACETVDIPSTAMDIVGTGGQQRCRSLRSDTTQHLRNSEKTDGGFVQTV